MRSPLYLLAFGLTLLSCSKKNGLPPVTTTGGGTVTTTQPKVYTYESTPSWSDEFDTGTKPDTSKWGYDVGGNGWGNHELEYYTQGNNVDIANGLLTITAKKENFAGMNYTSSRLYSKGTGNFSYGRFEIKAKIPGGLGTWPAIWMLPTDNAYGGWPNSGEMDIMEHVGFDPNNIYITMHTGLYNGAKGTQKGTAVSVPSSTTDFHVYRIDWTPDSVTGFIDGVQEFTFNNEQTGSPAWPFDKRFHFMLNVAVGGDWGGSHGIDNTAFPAAMQIDYIHVYKITNL